MSTETEIAVRECMRCHHRWVPRQAKPPRQCPECHSPYWQTARQCTKRGRPPKTQLIELDYQPKHRRTWGKWRLNKKPPYPTLDFPIMMGNIYEIDLCRCGTPRSRELWLKQISGKRYITSTDLGDLARAFIDLVHQGEIPVGPNK